MNPVDVIRNYSNRQQIETSPLTPEIKVHSIQIDKPNVVELFKSLISPDESSECQVGQPNSLDYHTNDQIEFVQEEPSPAGY